MTAAESILAVLKRHPRIDTAILFGSLARGEARPDSDLDLAVDAGSALTPDEKACLIADLADCLGRPVDLIDLARAGEPLLGQILRHGQRLQGCDDRYAVLLRRHILAMADFVPYRDRILAERRQAWIAG